MSNAPLMKESYYVEQMRNWIDRQSHLPKDLDDRLLYRFVHSCYFDLEKAKVTLETFVTIRGSTPEFVTNRDIEMMPLKEYDYVNVCVYNISNNKTLYVWQIDDPGFDNYNYVVEIKLFSLLMDTYLLTEEKISESFITIIDVKDINYKFMSTFNLSLCRKLLKYQQEALPIRLHQIHVVNASPFIDKVMAVMKPFLSKELLEMLHIHTPSSDTLFDFMKKEDLPADYGGSLPPVNDVKDELFTKIPKIRDVLLRNDLWTSVGKKDSEVSMDNGCFRSLNLD